MKAFVAGVFLGAAAVTALWLRADRDAVYPLAQTQRILASADGYCMRPGCHHLRANHPLGARCAIPGCSCEEFVP